MTDKNFISKHLPPALELKFCNRCLIKKYSTSDHSEDCKCAKTRSVGHNYIAYYVGTCQASCAEDNFQCPIEWACGFTEESLVDRASRFDSK